MPDATLSNTSLGRLAWLWLTVLIVVVDQASKYYFENALSLYQQIIVSPGLLQLDTGLQHGRRLQFSGGRCRLAALVVCPDRGRGQCSAGGLAQASGPR